MRRNKIRLYVHLVWTAWDRLPLLTPDMEGECYRIIESQASRLGCRVISINGMPDHVHLLLKMDSTHSIAEIVQPSRSASNATSPLRQLGQSDAAQQWLV